MRDLLRWSVALGVVAFAVFAARQVDSTTCATEREAFELEIESVTRDDSDVDDLGPWETYESRSIETRTRADGGEGVEFRMRTDRREVLRVRASKSNTGAEENQ